MSMGLQWGIAISFLWFIYAFCFIVGIGTLGFKTTERNAVKHHELSQDYWYWAPQDLM